MKKTAQKILALLLSVLLLIGFAAPMATVSAATVPDAKTYTNAADGELLYAVDFRGKDGIYKPVYYEDPTYKHTVFENGKNIQLDNVGATGGAVGELPLNNETVYTITMSLSLYGGWGFDVFFDRGVVGDKTRMHGFRIQQSQVTPSVSGSTPNYLKYEVLGFTPKNTSTDTTYPLHHYRITVDGINSVVSFAVLSTEDEYVQVQTFSLVDYDEDNPTFYSDKLHIIFNALRVGTGASNIKIYKGYINGSTEVTEPNKLLLDVADLTQAQTGNYGVTYTPGINESSGDAVTYTYDATENTHQIKSTAADAVFGGKTNLRLGHGNQYTIKYLAKLDIGGLGVRYSYTNMKISQGLYLCADNFSIASGVNKGADSCNGNEELFELDSKVNDSIFINNGYADVAIEIDGFAVAIYINGVRQDFDYTTLKNIRGKAGRGFNDNLLSLALHEYFDIESATSATFFYKDIKIYSGLTMSNCYLSIDIDGDVTTQIVNGEEYELPIVTKVGYIFRGWKVNGADTITAPATAVPTNGLESIEAVFMKSMSDVWVQFKDNGDSTQDMRIVSVIDSLSYKNVGYDVVIKYTQGGQEKTITQNDFQLTEVYSSLTAKYGTETVTLETLECYGGNGYLTAFAIKNIPTNIGEITFELTPYHTPLRQTQPVSGEPITLKLNNGVLVD